MIFEIDEKLANDVFGSLRFTSDTGTEYSVDLTAV